MQGPLDHFRWRSSSLVRRAGRTSRSHWRLGNGRILWWAGPTPLTNSGISKDGNLPFFLGCIQAVRPGANPGETTVLWDEYFRRLSRISVGLFREDACTVGGPSNGSCRCFCFARVWQEERAALLAGRGFATFALESSTNGDLYRRASAGSAAVRVAYQRFRTQLVRRLALAPSISNMQLDAAVRERLGCASFMDMLQRAEKAARENDVPVPDALKIAQALGNITKFCSDLRRDPTRRIVKWKISHASRRIFARSFPR